MTDTVADNLRREWWRITRRGERPMDVWFVPEQSRLEVMALYPGANVEAIAPTTYADIKE